MSECEAIRPLLSGRVYDDLPAGERDRVDAHVGGCAACRDALASMRKAASALDAWVLAPLAKPAAAERPPTARRRYISRTFGRAALLGWAAAAAVFVVALTLHLLSRPPAPTAPVSKGAPAPLPPPANDAALERERRELEAEIARYEEERRRSLQRVKEIESKRDQIREQVAKGGTPPPPQVVDQVEAELTQAVQELDRSDTGQRQAEVKLVHAEAKGTVAVVGQLDWVQGEVHILTESGKIPARTSKALVSGQGVETVGAHSMAVVRLPDATRLELGAATTVRELSDTDKGKRIDLVRGTVKADVRRQPDGRPLVLKTPDAESHVLGTRLRLTANGATRLDVHEGKVRLTRSKDGASVDIAGGTYAVTNVPRMVPKPIREVSFQDGTSPFPTYAGTRDTFLSEHNATHPYGTNAKLQADGDNPGATGKELRLLIRWDLASIPPGSKIQTATLILQATSPSRPPYAVHAMKRSWSETEATWATSSGEAGSAVLGFALPNGPAEFIFPLNADGVALVQSWVDSPGSNSGLMITATGNTNGMQVHSRESSEAGKRPRLVVTFTPR